MDISYLDVILLALASFRLTRLLVYDKIAEFIRAPFFEEKEEVENGEIQIYYVPKKGTITHFFGELLSCYWCTSVWATAFLLAVYYFFPLLSTFLNLLLAIAGLAAIIESIVQLFIKE